MNIKTSTIRTEIGIERYSVRAESDDYKPEPGEIITDEPVTDGFQTKVLNEHKKDN